MSGEINRQTIVYKLVAHLLDVGLASIDDFFKSADSLKLAGNLLIIERTSAYFEGHRSMVCPFQFVDRCPADAHDVRAGTARLPVDASRTEKIGRASENF